MLVLASGLLAQPPLEGNRMTPSRTGPVFWGDGDPQSRGTVQEHCLWPSWLCSSPIRSADQLGSGNIPYPGSGDLLHLINSCTAFRLRIQLWDGWEEGDGKACSLLMTCMWEVGGSSIAPSFGAVISERLSHSIITTLKCVPAPDLLQWCSPGAVQMGQDGASGPLLPVARSLLFLAL